MKHNLRKKLDILNNNIDFFRKIETENAWIDFITDLIIEIEKIEERFDILESRISEIEHKTLG